MVMLSHLCVINNSDSNVHLFVIKSIRCVYSLLPFGGHCLPSSGIGSGAVGTLVITGNRLCGRRVPKRIITIDYYLNRQVC